jgi:predicted transcriptional regulator
MKIDFQATKQKMVNAGLNLTRWAKGRDHSPVTVLAILSGKYPSYEANGRRLKAIIRDLRQDGYLVEVPDQSDRAA